MQNSFLSLFILISLIFLYNSCSEDVESEKESPPEVATSQIREITYTSARVFASVNWDGKPSITVSGICWGTTSEPTINDNKTTDGPTTVKAFETDITGLTPNTTYFVRAYATNKIATSYGNILSLTTTTPEQPVLGTSTITSITQTSASISNVIASEMGATVTARGVCWSTNINPTIADNMTTDGSGIGNYTSNITGLTANTKYYARAYATNSVGTSYGNVVTFSTWVTDVDGNVYETVTIGTQVWFAENLKTTKYSNGDAIPTTSSATTDISSEISPKYQWAYNGLDANVANYGRLYTWFTVTDSRNVCPAGWHVPTKDEWITLGDNLGGHEVAGKKMKETGTVHWLTNAGATNESGFAALPGGQRQSNGEFKSNGVVASWWSSTDYNDPTAWERRILANDDILYQNVVDKKYGVSVRCIRD